MNLDSANRYKATIPFLLCAALAGCNPGSGVQIDASTAQKTYQAIDGFIVSGTVFCDGVRNGQTGAAGRFTCPEDTTLITVRGGSDVGFDESATAGGTPFIGELQGPATSNFITPLTTVATKMSIREGVFNDQQYQESENILTEALGISSYTLEMNPVDHLPLLKANSQMHQLIAEFAATVDEYATVSTELAKVLNNGTPIDLRNDTNTIVSALNQQLSVNSPGLALTPINEAALSGSLTEKNAEIEGSESVAELESVVAETVGNNPIAFSISKDSPIIAYQTYGQDSFYSLAEFYDPNTYFDYHRVQFKEDWRERIHLSADALNIKKTIDKATVDVALELKSTSDNRQVSATLSGVKLSMDAPLQGTNKVAVEVPQGAVINATAINASGVETDVSIQASDNYFTSEGGGFVFDLHDVNREIRNAGHKGILYEDGHYQMTVVISGIRFSVLDSDSEQIAAEYTVSNGIESVTGLGLRGYVSRIAY